MLTASLSANDMQTFHEAPLGWSSRTELPVVREGRVALVRAYGRPRVSGWRRFELANGWGTGELGILDPRAAGTKIRNIRACMGGAS